MVAGAGGMWAAGSGKPVEDGVVPDFGWSGGGSGARRARRIPVPARRTMAEVVILGA